MISVYRAITTLLLLFFLSMQVHGACDLIAGLSMEAYQCDDGTVSFEQPDLNSGSDEFDTYEGLCGPTAAANVFHAYCDSFFVDPLKLALKYFKDVTPGTRPDTLERGLNKLFRNNDECLKGEWKYYYVTNRWSYLNSLYYETHRGVSSWTRVLENGSKATRSPVIALISRGSDGSTLHYVTVVDVVGYDPNGGTDDYENESCRVIYNEWGDQDSTSCKKFVNWAHQVDNHGALGWMPEYIHFVFEKGQQSYVSTVTEYTGLIIEELLVSPLKVAALPLLLLP